MHRLILGAKPGQFVDHINGNGLDNQRSNLRLASRAQNNRNARRRADNTTGHRGVGHDRGRFRATIYAGGQRINLGNYGTPLEAARAYDLVAKPLHGEYARLNAVVVTPEIDTRIRAVLRNRGQQLADLVQDQRIVTELLGGTSVNRSAA
jgi:hypothetical protein